MKSLLILCLALFKTTAWAGDLDVQYKDLSVSLGRVQITNVESLGAVNVKDPLWEAAIELKVAVRGDSGKQILLETIQKDVISFAEIQSVGPHTQPGHEYSIQYFWTPSDLDMPVESSKDRTLKIVSASGETFTVKAKITRHFGDASNGGFGNYFTYTDIKVTSAKKPSSTKK